MLVRGENFYKLADVVLNYYGKEVSDQYCLKDGDVVYCDTHRLIDYADWLSNFKDLTIITHNSDGSIVEDSSRFDDIDYRKLKNCYKVWFAQNCKVNKDNIIPLPIGFENIRWDLSGIKRKTYSSLSLDIEPDGLVYLNVGSINTNYQHRKDCYDKCQSMDFIKIDEPKYNYYEYMKHMLNYKFVICPYGNGIDCHRNWEVLFLNRIPIMISGPLEKIYRGFPVLFVDDWLDLKDIDLEYEYEIISKSINRDILQQEYWDKIIQR